MDLLALVSALTEETVFLVALVFTRVSAFVGLLPGFGERSIPARVRLVVAIAFTLISWPIIAPNVPKMPDSMFETLPLFLIEALIGMGLGLAIRLMVLVLQLAGSIAAQATSLSQIMGAGATPDPLPAMGNMLVIAGLALAVVSGLHIKAVAAIAYSYTVLPFGLIPAAQDVTPWGISQISHAFSFGFTLAAPFVIISFAYNVTLGVINRAMPQLMVAFIGAPAITAGGLLVLLLAAPILLNVWNQRLDTVLSDPLGLRQ